MIIEERKNYSIIELREILSTYSKGNIDKKLRRYGIEFQTNGRGDKCVYTIKTIADPFKVYCIFELDFDAKTDFYKLRQFLYHFFCDEIFMSMPDEMKAQMMDEWEPHISRQTIAKYQKHLADKNYISTIGAEYNYYFAYKNTRIFTDKETYCKAWRHYWHLIKDFGFSSKEAIGNMIYTHGGVAKKHMKVQLNAFTLNNVNELVDIIGDSIENELGIWSN